MTGPSRIRPNRSIIIISVYYVVCHVVRVVVDVGVATRIVVYSLIMDDDSSVGVDLTAHLL